MTPHETAVKIAEAVMDAIEKRRGIIKDDIVEAARSVLAGSMSGSYTVRMHAEPLPSGLVAFYGDDIIKIGWKEK